MRLKLDENLGPSAAALFRDAGHDVLLAVEQGLGGNEDRVLIEVCRAEDRAMVTLDLSCWPAVFLVVRGKKRLLPPVF